MLPLLPLPIAHSIMNLFSFKHRYFSLVTLPAEIIHCHPAFHLPLDPPGPAPGGVLTRIRSILGDIGMQAKLYNPDTFYRDCSYWDDSEMP